MPDPLVFGYGSLVNAATHDLPRLAPARLTGWSRTWRAARGRPVAYLTAMRGGDGIDGAVAMVPGADWAALDRREAAYDRHEVTCDGSAGPLQAQVHALPACRAVRAPPPVILRSYLDTVIDGFLAVHGAAAARRFFPETGGWTLEVRDDRAAPLYPRHVPATPRARGIVEAGLASVRAPCGRGRVRAGGPGGPS